eukprot:2658642-Amphidinium_carterae.1
MVRSTSANCNAVSNLVRLVSKHRNIGESLARYGVSGVVSLLWWCCGMDKRGALSRMSTPRLSEFTPQTMCGMMRPKASLTKRA